MRGSGRSFYRFDQRGRQSESGRAPSASVPWLSLTVKGPCACACACAHRDEYFRMKVQWKSVSEEQEMRNSLLRGYRSLIGQSVKHRHQQALLACGRRR